MLKCYQELIDYFDSKLINFSFTDKLEFRGTDL